MQLSATGFTLKPCGHFSLVADTNSQLNAPKSFKKASMASRTISIMRKKKLEDIDYGILKVALCCAVLCCTELSLEPRIA